MSKTHSYFFPISTIPWETSFFEQITRDGKVVALDIDDTLADFVGHMVSVYGEPVFESMSSGSLEVMWPHIDWGTALADEILTRDMPVMDGSLELAHDLACRAPIAYVTARPKELSWVTSKWLSYHGFPPAPVACLGKELKAGFLRSGMFKLIIDDNPKAMRIAQQVGAKRFCVAQPWNEDENYRMTIQEITNEVRSL